MNRAIICTIVCQLILIAGAMGAGARPAAETEGPATGQPTRDDAAANDLLEKFGLKPIARRPDRNAAKPRMPFVAVCEARRALAFREATDIRGKRTAGGWTGGDAPDRPRVFNLVAKNYITIDNEPARIMAEFADGFIFGRSRSTDLEATVELYIWNRKLGTIVSTSAYGQATGKMTGIGIRSMEYDCDFHETG